MEQSLKGSQSCPEDPYALQQTFGLEYQPKSLVKSNLQIATSNPTHKSAGWLTL
jgi:hypothetical protein